MGRRKLEPCEPLTVKIVNLYKGGASKKKISALVFMSVSGITHRLKSAGVQIINPKGKLPDNTVRKIKKLRSEGLSYEKVGILCGVSASSAKKYGREL